MRTQFWKVNSQVHLSGYLLHLILSTVFKYIYFIWSTLQVYIQYN